MVVVIYNALGSGWHELNYKMFFRLSSLASQNFKVSQTSQAGILATKQYNIIPMGPNKPPIKENRQVIGAKTMNRIIEV